MLSLNIFVKECSLSSSVQIPGPIFFTFSSFDFQLFLTVLQILNTYFRHNDVPVYFRIPRIVRIFGRIDTNTHRIRIEHNLWMCVYIKHCNTHSSSLCRDIDPEREINVVHIFCIPSYQNGCCYIYHPLPFILFLTSILLILLYLNLSILK